ncbi:type III-A CRISPR-associated protein Cas10/Csm1 [Thermoplasma sp. Kam2015]|uniref:type III-A CRISPR-associated protein Cas10/Csm1 n=1 Tax=Thermoplasma sp. Kam2015 TaxID=2094122 RepID=UPI00137A2A55|nr:type III-A CRISPR-associated protein Cas10/Csm1 [Thermoplasma sp. Kam2015]
MDEDEFILACAALLHDVGKIRTRYRRNKKHAAHGEEMLRESLNGSLGEYRERIIDLVANHHSEKSYRDDDEGLLKILKESDRLSASHDREEYEDKLEHGGSDVHLKSIYSYIKDHKNQSGGINLMPTLSLKDFSKKDLTTLMNSSENTTNALRMIDEDLCEDLKHLSLQENKNAFVDNLVTLIDQYTWAVSSAYYYDQPTISLSAHLRLTAAIAHARLHNEREFLLLGGDVSGIQAYLSRFRKTEDDGTGEGADEKAAKRFRGRSFSIYLLVDAVIAHIRKELDVGLYSVITQSSGGFLMLVPLKSDTEEKLKKIRKEIEKMFMDHRGLGMAIGWVRERFEDLPRDDSNEKRKNFRVMRSELTIEIERRKRGILSDDPSSIDFYTPPSSSRLCNACGLRPIDSESDGKCRICKEEEDLGALIAKMSESKNFITLSDKGVFTIEIGKQRYSYGGEMDDSGVREFLFLDPNIQPFRSGDKVSRMLLVGHYTPKKDGKVKTFEDIGVKSISQDLCLFKGDVDNFGYISSGGLVKDTISTFETLSLYTSLFFSTVLDKIAKKHETYVVYSGGDDVTAVARFDKAVEFAIDLRDSFRRWTLNRVTMSAGMFNFSGDKPIRYAIEMGEEYLHRSKGFKKNGSEKDAVTIFDTTLPWNELSKQNEVAKIINEYIVGCKHISHGFPYFLNSLNDYNPYVDHICKGTLIKVPDPYLYYYLTRNWKEQKCGHKMEEFREKILNEQVFKYIKVAASLSALYNKKSDGDVDDGK